MRLYSAFRIPHSALFFMVFWLFGFGFAMHASQYPEPINDYVSDYAGIINAGDEQAITESLKHLEKSSGIELTVLTIKSISQYNTSDVSVEEFATNLFNTWGIGHKKENNGILLLVSVNDRKMRIELGKAYEYQYDAAMQEVINSRIIPYFKQGDFSRGVYEGVEGIIEKVTKKVSFWQYYWPHMLIGLLIIVCILAGISFMKQGKKGWGYTFFVIAGILIFLLLKLLASGKSRPGFGGGSSFGGGASGSW